MKITQTDVRAIQLAKAALYAGIALLMERLGIAESRRVRGLGTNQRTALEHEFGGGEI